MSVVVVSACYAFRSTENCAVDTDCATDMRCEANVKRCVPRGEAFDAAADTSATDGPRETNDAVSPACDALPWGTPTPVLGLEREPLVSARFSADELSMFVARGAPPNGTELYTYVRSAADAPFRLGAPLANVNEPGTGEFWPTTSRDGKLLFFESTRTRTPSDAGVYAPEMSRIWSATRVNVAVDFDRPRLQSLFDIDLGAEAAPYLHPLGRSLYFASIGRPGKGSLDIWVATINDVGVVTDIRNVDGVNTAQEENAPVVSDDELSLYHSGVSTTGRGLDIFVATRSTPRDTFVSSAPLASVSSDFDDYPTWVSADHCRLYLSSNRPLPRTQDAGDGGVDGEFHMWVSARVR
jgi:hypothetical protein